MLLNQKKMNDLNILKEREFLVKKIKKILCNDDNFSVKYEKILSAFRVFERTHGVIDWKED